jgi:hypothetical protein
MWNVTRENFDVVTNESLLNEFREDKKRIEVSSYTHEVLSADRREVSDDSGRHPPATKSG